MLNALLKSLPLIAVAHCVWQAI